jgi:putative transposase
VFDKRDRTPSEHIGHGLYLYFLGLSLRNFAKALSFLHNVRRTRVAVCKWIQKYRPKPCPQRETEFEFIFDETAIKAGSDHLWLWVAIEPKYRRILAITVSKERNIYVANRLWQAWSTHGKDVISTDGRTWYPQACGFPKIKHRIQSSYEKHYRKEDAVHQR